MTISVVLSKEDCYLSLPDFYEMLAHKVSKCTGSSRPSIDCTNIKITPAVFEEIKQFHVAHYDMTLCEVYTMLVIYGPKPDLSEKENTPYMATWKG